MNAFLSPEEKTTAPTQGLGVVHGVSRNATDEKTVAVLLEAAENEEQKRRKAVSFHNAVGGIVFFAYAALLVAFCLDSLFFHLNPSVANRIVHLLLVIMVFNGAFQMGIHHLSDAHTKKRKDVAAALLQFPNEPRSLLPFIDALHVPHSPEWKKLLFPSLTEHLWNLSPTDAALSLDDTRRATLRDTLAQAYAVMANGRREARYAGYFDDVTTDLAVAIMKTLAGLGDKKSEKVLEKIIKAEANTPNETVVCDAAREYLPVLLQNIAENDMVRQKLDWRLGERIRNPEKVVGEFIDTLSAEHGKVTLVAFLRSQKSRTPWVTIPGMCGIFFAAIIAFTFLCAMWMPLFISSVIIGLPFLSSVLLLIVYGKKNNLGAAGHTVTYDLSRRCGNDVRFIPFLLDAAHDDLNRTQDDAVKKALARLLPLLRPGDAALVPPAQRATLRAWLTIPRNKKRTKNNSQTLTIAALDALAAVGDTKASPAAEKIARQTRSGNYHETELHEAALRCVEALRARKGNRS